LKIFPVCFLESVEAKSAVENGTIIAVMVRLIEVEFIKTKVTEGKFLSILHYACDLLICEDVVSEFYHLMILRAFLYI
jgi:hypothetical protein